MSAAAFGRPDCLGGTVASLLTFLAFLTVVDTGAPLRIFPELPNAEGSTVLSIFFLAELGRALIANLTAIFFKSSSKFS